MTYIVSGGALNSTHSLIPPGIDGIPVGFYRRESVTFGAELASLQNTKNGGDFAASIRHPKAESFSAQGSGLCSLDSLTRGSAYGLCRGFCRTPLRALHVSTAHFIFDLGTPGVPKWTVL